MTLDELIAQMTNPQEFTRLCNSIFTDIYGHDYQVIDGSRSDGGNDGYVESERRMLAMYCPMKPERKTDADYVEKIRTDIEKAAALKQSNKYDIATWTFITPRKLANNVIAKMRTLGDNAGFRATHQESTFLANELYRRGHLLKGFPTLHQIDLGAKIDQLARMLSAKQIGPSVESPAVAAPLPAVIDEAGDIRFHQIMEEIPTLEAKAELRAMAYGTTDPILEINAILALFRWFDPSDDDRRELLAFADRGIDRAKRIGQRDAEALFHAQKAAMLLWEFNTSVIESHYAQALRFLLPFQATASDQMQRDLTKLRELEGEWKSETATAIDLAKESRDLESVGNVLVVLGTSMGQVAQTYRQLGQSAAADQGLAECKALLMAAKDAYSVGGDELGATNAIFNLANQVRWHAGKHEALILVKQTIPVAEKYGDRLLLQKARWLQHTLETDEIPDYAAGQRRVWAAAPPNKSEASSGKIQ